jgi:hypothetical protein
VAVVQVLGDDFIARLSGIGTQRIELGVNAAASLLDIG